MKLLPVFLCTEGVNEVDHWWSPPDLTSSYRRK